jgi:uncharacterized membrane protein
MDFINSLIYTIFTLHPIHAILVHFPIALSGAAFLFILIAWWKKNRDLEKAAYFNLILTALSSILVAGTGIYDNIVRWDSSAEFHVEKIVLGIIMIILSMGTVYLRWFKPDIFERKNAKGLYIASYGIIFLISLILGFLGGVIVYGYASPSQTTDNTAVTSTPPSAIQSTDISDATAANVRFSTDVLPILDSSCVKCHNSSVARDGVAVDTYANLLTGGTVVANNADDSSLLSSVVSGRMPPGTKKLTAAQIQLIVDWINQGAPDN